MYLNIQANTAPQGTCPSTINDWIKLVEQFCVVPFNDNYSLFVYGSTTPAVEDQNKPWIRLNDDGSLKGIYVYFNGEWRTNEQFTKGDIIMYSGLVGDIVTPWQPCINGIGTVNGVVVPDLRDKFIVGAGNSYAVGATGGESTHVLTLDELTPHDHIPTVRGPCDPSYPATYGTTDAGSSGRVVAPADAVTSTFCKTSSSGGGAAHENRPPYYALMYKIYVGFN